MPAEELPAERLTPTTLQLADAIANLLDLRLHVGVGVLPKLDELRVVRQRLVDIPLRFMQFAKSAVYRWQPRGPLHNGDGASLRIPRIHRNR